MKENQIYKITNLLNNKVYIGLTIQGARTRYIHHLYETRSGSKFPIHNSIRKHGMENFNLEILETSENSETLKELEKHYIKLYNSNNRKLGYNLTEGGDGTLGRKHSEETKSKIRNKAFNRIVSEETKNRMKASHEKLEALGLKKRKEVEVYLEDKLIGRFRSLTKAAKFLNIAHQSISDSLKLEKEYCKGYKFKLIQ